ncbi:MAG: hypothetical protein U0869_13090 [Chloroflexota bacterium]
MSAISGMPAAIGADLLGLRGATAPEATSAAPVPRPSPVAPPPPPADLRPWRVEGGALLVVDQRALPGAHVELRGDPVAAAVSLIEGGAVPAGPAIAEVAVTAYLASARETLTGPDAAAKVRSLGWNLRLLRTARPSSGALAAALLRLEGAIADAGTEPDPAGLLERLEAAGDGFLDELRRGCVALVAAGGEVLAEHLGDGPGLLTLGTSGPLAGGGAGSAIGVMAAVARRLPGTRAFIAETRPSLLGARIGALELMRLGVPTTVVPDAAIPELVRAGLLRAAIVPAEGVTAGGDLVGIAGTAGLAAQLAVAGVPLIVAAPTPTTEVPVAEPTASAIPRAAADLLTAEGRRIAAPGADGWASLVDLTPRALLGARLDEAGARPIDPA